MSRVVIRILLEENARIVCGFVIEVLFVFQGQVLTELLTAVLKLASRWPSLLGTLASLVQYWFNFQELYAMFGAIIIIFPKLEDTEVAEGLRPEDSEMRVHELLCEASV